MSITEIRKLSVKEKLKLMEALWEDLSANAANIPVPQWQKDVLDARRRKIAEGKAHFTDWETAKKSIRKKLA